MNTAPHTVEILLFDGFEMLDVVGPLSLLDHCSDEYAISCVAPAAGPVRSAQGLEMVAERGWEDSRGPEIVLVPGGMGSRTAAEDDAFLTSLRRWASPADIITSVCTGSALLAAAGLLEGYRATSNKRAFAWASQFGDDVAWVPRARWVHDRDRWTSSGVAAGMDMTAALIAELSGPDAARQTADRIELETHDDPDWDPFAALRGTDSAQVLPTDGA